MTCGNILWNYSKYPLLPHTFIGYVWYPFMILDQTGLFFFFLYCFTNGWFLVLFSFSHLLVDCLLNRDFFFLLHSFIQVYQMYLWALISFNRFLMLRSFQIKPVGTPSSWIICPSISIRVIMILFIILLYLGLLSYYPRKQVHICPVPVSQIGVLIHLSTYLTCCEFF